MSVAMPASNPASVCSKADAGGGYSIGWVKAGEWLEYTVNVANAGNYQLDLRAAADWAYGGTFHVEFNGVDKTGPLAFPATGGWHRVDDGTKQRWTVADANDTADHSLVTPAFTVNAAFKVTFDHRYSFESSGGANYDGAVLEATADDGATWQDVGALASPGYTGIIDFNDSTNPERSSRGGSVLRKPLPTSTCAGCLKVPIRFRTPAALTAVFPPIAASTCPRSVVGT